MIVRLRVADWLATNPLTRESDIKKFKEGITNCIKIAGKRKKDMDDDSDIIISDQWIQYEVNEEVINQGIQLLLKSQLYID